MFASLLSGIKPTLIVGGILLSLLLGLGGIFYWYYDNSQTKIENLTNKAQAADLAYHKQAESYDKLQKDMGLQKKLVSDLQKKLVSATADKEVLSEKLRKHDLEELARSKPGLVEDIINKATQKFYDDMSAESKVK